MDPQADNHLNSLIRAVTWRLGMARVLSRATQAAFGVAAGIFVLAGFRNVLTYAHMPVTGIVLACGAIWLCWKLRTEVGSLSDPVVAARQIDRQAGLENRVATAVEIQNLESGAMTQLLMQDAVASVHGLKPESVVRLPSATSPISAILALIAAVLLLLASPLIVPSASASPTLQTVHSEASINRLVEILQSILANLKSTAEANPSTELDALIEDTEDALLAIQQGDLTTAEAYLELSKLQQQMLAESQSDDVERRDGTWQKVAEALSSSQATEAIANSLQLKQFQDAAGKMQQLDSEAFAKDKLTPAEVTSLTEKLAEAANQTDDEDLANVLKDLSKAISDGKSDTAKQKMQDLAGESAKYQIELDQAEHLDELSEQLEMGKQQLAITSNSSGDGQMGGKGLNEETGKSKGKGGADSQKAGAKTAGNIDGPKADLNGQKQLAELQGQFGEEGEVEVKTKSTDERPDFEINRKAQSVITEYSRQIEADLKQQQVPPGHQGIVRKYFESIRPASGERNE